MINDNIFLISFLLVLRKFGMSETFGSAIVETDRTKVAAYV